jgi:hypothetical protein
MAMLLVVPAGAVEAGPEGPTVIKRELIRESARISDIGQAAARDALTRAFTEPLTEAQVVAELSQAMIDAGSSELLEGFEAIVASGTASAIPHGDPTDDADNYILPGEVVVVDIGARYAGWVSDNTKTYFIGVEPPELFRTAYALVVEAQDLAVAQVRSGQRAVDIDTTARSFLAEAGYEEEFMHCLGHGVGLQVHVPPMLCPGSDDVLLASRNDVVAIEPGLYFDGCFGLRLEDDFAVLRAGAERYTFAPSALTDIMIAPPADWNGSSPTGEFADYAGCAFEVDVRAAAGAPPAAVVGGGAGAVEGAGAVVAIAAALAAAAAAYVWRVPLARRARGLLRRT